MLACWMNGVSERRARGYTAMRSATATIIAATIIALALGCGPEVRDGDDDDDGDEISGSLEYEHAYARIYRAERRVDAVLWEANGERRVCGVLTDRAHEELEDTLANLDPSVDYGHDPATQDCTPAAQIHVAGLPHSPFECSWQCCRPELMRAALIYLFIESHFSYGKPLELDGEPYVAVEPGVPCPE